MCLAWNGEKPSVTEAALRVLLLEASSDANLPETPEPDRKDTEVFFMGEASPNGEPPTRSRSLA